MALLKDEHVDVFVFLELLFDLYGEGADVDTTEVDFFLFCWI